MYNFSATGLAPTTITSELGCGSKYGASPQECTPRGGNSTVDADPGPNRVLRQSASAFAALVKSVFSGGAAVCVSGINGGLVEGVNIVTPSDIYIGLRPDCVSPDIRVDFHLNSKSIFMRSWVNLSGSLSGSEAISTLGILAENSGMHVFVTKSMTGAIPASSRGILRGTMILCKALFSDSTPTIVPCCEELIPSSKTKRNIVHSASIAMPPITSQNAILWTDAGYLGRSNIMPAPTPKLANTLINNSQKWGHPGANSPESNLLKYAQAAAIIAWLSVSMMAIIQLVKSIMSYLKEKRK